MNYSERMKLLRTGHHDSQQKTASILGVALRTYQYYERGQREPTVSVIIALAELYGVSTDYLLGVSDERGEDLHE